jgi:hypothetical protein
VGSSDRELLTAEDIEGIANSNVEAFQSAFPTLLEEAIDIARQEFDIKCGRFLYKSPWMRMGHPIHRKLMHIDHVYVRFLVFQRCIFVQVAPYPGFVKKGTTQGGATIEVGINGDKVGDLIGPVFGNADGESGCAWGFITDCDIIATICYAESRHTVLCSGKTYSGDLPMNCFKAKHSLDISGDDQMAGRVVTENGRSYLTWGAFMQEPPRCGRLKLEQHLYTGWTTIECPGKWVRWFEWWQLIETTCECHGDKGTSPRTVSRGKTVKQGDSLDSLPAEVRSFFPKK